MIRVRTQFKNGDIYIHYFMTYGETVAYVFAIREMHEYGDVLNPVVSIERDGMEMWSYEG